MLKRMWLVLAAVIVSGVVCSAQAQDMSGQQGVGAQIGYFMPGGDLGDNNDAGLGFGVHYFRGLQNNLGVLAKVNMTTLGASSSGSGDYKGTEISVNGVYSLPAADLPVMPFAFLGLAYHMQTIETGGGDVDGDGIGFNIGVGANRMINDKWTVGLSLAYKTLPDFDLPAGLGGGTADANAMVIGVHASMKLGS